MKREPGAVQKLIHRFLMMKPVSAFLAKVLQPIDELALRLTNDRHSVAELVGLPILRLTTIGAKTGQPRVTPLVGLADGRQIALIASSFGRAHNPGWYYNLKAHPECTVVFNGRSGKYIARETEGDEYWHFWRMAVSLYAGYEKYKERAAHRHIPVMVLEPKE